MIIPGSLINLNQMQELLRDQILDKLGYRGKSLNGLTVTRRFSRVHCDDCSILVDHGDRTCSFKSTNYNSYELELCVLDLRGAIQCNARAQFVLASYGTVYVDCWNSGNGTEIRAIPGCQATLVRDTLVTDTHNASTFLVCNESILEEIIDEINECRKNPEFCGPIGCPGHKSTPFFSNCDGQEAV